MERPTIPGIAVLLMAAGGGLLHRAVTGQCQLYKALNMNTAERGENGVTSVHHGEGIKVEHALAIDRSAEDLYRFWRNVENLPTFMRNLESVRILNDGRSHWAVKAPAGKTVEWDAEIHNEIENELIAWRSLEGADINNAGSVHFRTLPDGRTEVKVDDELRAAIRPVRLGDRKTSRRGSGSTTSRRFVALQTDDGNWRTQRRD